MATTTQDNSASQSATTRNLPFWLPQNAQASLWYGLFLMLIFLAVDWWAWSDDKKNGGWLPNWLLYAIFIQLMLAFVLYHFAKLVWEPMAERDQEELEQLLVLKTQRTNREGDLAKDDTDQVPTQDREIPDEPADEASEADRTDEGPASEEVDQ